MKKRGQRQSPEAEYYADTMEQEEQLKKNASLNQEAGIFVNAFADGLNREKSVFDRMALFLTKQGEQT